MSCSSNKRRRMTDGKQARLLQQFDTGLDNQELNFHSQKTVLNL